MPALVATRAAGQLRYIDCSHIRLRQDGANPRGGQAAQAIGRTKGGISTKLAAIVEGGGRAVAPGLPRGTAPRIFRGRAALALLAPPSRSRRQRLRCRHVSGAPLQTTYADLYPPRSALAVGQWPFTAATSGGAIRSKTSSAVPSATGASAPDTKNSPQPSSASFS